MTNPVPIDPYATVPSDAPAHSEGELRGLDPRVVRVWRIESVVRGLLYAAAAFGIARLFDRDPVGIAVIVLILALSSAVLWPPARYRRWAFAVRPGDLLIQHGVLWRTESLVPHARIQHVDTRQGPLERWIGLASVVLFTAGSVGASLTIPGLAAEHAEALRDQLIALSGADDAV